MCLVWTPLVRTLEDRDVVGFDLTTEYQQPLPMDEPELYEALVESMGGTLPVLDWEWTAFRSRYYGTPSTEEDARWSSRWRLAWRVHIELPSGGANELDVFPDMNYFGAYDDGVLPEGSFAGYPEPSEERRREMSYTCVVIGDFRDRKSAEAALDLAAPYRSADAPAAEIVPLGDIGVQLRLPLPGEYDWTFFDADAPDARPLLAACERYGGMTNHEERELEWGIAGPE